MKRGFVKLPYDKDNVISYCYTAVDKINHIGIAFEEKSKNKTLIWRDGDESTVYTCASVEDVFKAIKNEQYYLDL